MTGDTGTGQCKAMTQNGRKQCKAAAQLGGYCEKHQPKPNKLSSAYRKIRLLPNDKPLCPAHVAAPPPSKFTHVEGQMAMDDLGDTTSERKRHDRYRDPR